MDDFCQYHLFREPRPPLFIPPPYVRTAEIKGEREQTPILHLRVSDPSRILLLCESLKDHCTIDLEAKINSYLMEEANCEYAFLASFEIIPGKAVVKVMGIHCLEPDIQISTTDPIIAAIGQSKQPIELPVEQLPGLLQGQLRTFNKSEITGDVTIHPIFEQVHRNGITEESSNLCIGVFLVNSTMQSNFLGYLVQECFRFVLPILRSTIAYERETKIKAYMQDLVTMAILFFASKDNNHLLQLVKEKGRVMFQSERCDLYFINRKRQQLEGKILCDGKEVDDFIPSKQGILGFVYSQKKLLNVSNPQSNPMFVQSDDKKCNLLTRNILAFPLSNDGENVIGCVQVKNKCAGEYNIVDEKMAPLFASMAALAFQNMESQKQLEGVRHREEVANKLLIYEYHLRNAEVEHLLHAVRHKPEDFDLPTFNARLVPKHRIGIALMTMFEDLELVKIFHLEVRDLARFLLIIEKGYFDHPYHNIEHAFSAVHFIYATVYYLKLIEIKVLTPLETMALLIAAICHNIDHRGLTNAFRTMGNSTFASLYASSRSIMEAHHFAQTITVLNIEGCNFLTSLSSEDYTTCLKLIKHNIMATDYTEHLKHYQTQEALLSRGFRPKLEQHKLLFCSLMMTCSDFADHLRDWRTVRNVVAGMYQEFFNEDTLGKALNREPVNIDRDKDSIATLQIDFLRDIVLPPFKILVQMYPDMHFCIDNLYETMSNWEISKPHFINRDVGESPSLEMLLDGRLSLTNLEACEEKQDEEESYHNYM